MQNKLWMPVIVGGWIAMAAASSILEIKRDLAPASDWLAVSEIHVYDAWAGEAPFISVDREIKQPFHGEWFVTVRRVSDGTNSFACLAEGRADYATDARIPPNSTMDWWTYPARCRLDPGRYRMDTQWRIHAQGFPEKVARARSNTFEIHASPWRSPP